MYRIKARAFILSRAFLSRNHNENKPVSVSDAGWKTERKVPREADRQSRGGEGQEPSQFLFLSLSFFGFAFPLCRWNGRQTHRMQKGKAASWWPKIRKRRRRGRAPSIGSRQPQVLILFFIFVYIASFYIKQKIMRSFIVSLITGEKGPEKSANTRRIGDDPDTPEHEQCSKREVEIKFPRHKHRFTDSKYIIRTEG